MNPADFADVELDTLIELFYPDSQALGQFTAITAAKMPENFRDLLAHNHHMTVTVERHHGCLVDVEVLDARLDGNRYSRKILLRRQSDQRAVMFGIVRMNLGVVSPDVRAEIQSQQTPLGRILIEHNVWREVKLLDLYDIDAGADLLKSVGATGSRCFGRTALIYCDGQPAIELLEIVGG